MARSNDTNDCSPIVPVWEATPAAAARAGLGESPLWDGKAGLRWLDIEGQHLFTLGVDASVQSVRLSRRVTAVELGPDRQLLAVTSHGFGWLDPLTGLVDQVVTVLDDETISMNDAAIDPCGHCWAGSAVRDNSRKGALYRFDGQTVSAQLHGLGMSNGIDWSPEGDVLYHVDSWTGILTAWEYDLVTGKLGAARVMRSVPAQVGLPDGLIVDAEGNIWLAIWGAGRIWRLNPKTGETTAVVEVPTPYTTSCAFGGPDLSTLYITTANYEEPPGGGLLYSVDVPAPGRQPQRFAGSLR